MKHHLGPSSRPQSSGLRLAGLVVAGFPSPAEEELRDILSFDDYLVPRPGASFVLQVSGDSMSGAGILPGDLVVVEKGRTPRNGDIVIAEVDGRHTMKSFFRERGRVTLEAANPKYPTLVPQSEIRLIGVVTACVRKYAL